MNCDPSNLIHCISCNGCNSKYIKDTVGSKVKVHKQQIAHQEFRM